MAGGECEVSLFLKSIGALYALDYERRTKTCVHCFTTFCDVTKRNLRHTCSDVCDSASMVAKRRLRGNFAQTEEQMEKKRFSCKATYASRNVFGPELRQKFSETMKRTWREGKIDAANHWSKTSEGRARISARVKGRKLGPQPKMSEAAQRRLRNKRETLYTSAHGGHRNDLNMYFRSNWEANFARVLNLQGRSWEYESRSFQLAESLSYTPDFLCDGVFYEVKGRMDEKSKRQLDLMKERYPDVIIEVIDGDKYADLRVRYKTHIPLWEGK